MSNLQNVGLYFVTSALLLVIAVCLFNLLTRYKVWEEIQKGNMAVGLASGGMILGMARIIQVAINTNHSIEAALKWGALGMVMLILTYWIFEWVTPKLNVNEEIQKGNRAVGVISLVFSLAISMIISACIA